MCRFPGFVVVTVLLAMILGVAAPAFAFPVPTVDYLDAYNKADLVCMGRFTEMAGADEAGLLAQGRIPVLSLRFSAVFSAEVIFKGTEPPGKLAVELPSEEGRIMFGPSRQETGLVLFLKKVEDRYCLVVETPYCGIAVYTGGALPAVDLPSGTATGPDEIIDRETKGRRLLWEYLKSVNTAYRALGYQPEMREYSPDWPRFLWQAIVDIGGSPELKEERDQLLRDLSSSQDSDQRVQALTARSNERDATAFVETYRAFEAGQLSLLDLQKVSGTLHWFHGPGQNFQDIDILARVLALRDPLLTKNVTYALRFSDSDEAVPLLLSLLDNEDLDVKLDAVLGLAQHEQGDKEFVLSSEYQPDYDSFRANPMLYTNRWKAWWSQHGKEKYAFLQEQAAGK